MSIPSMQFVTLAAAAGPSVILTASDSKLTIYSIDIFLSAGDLIVHKGSSAGTGNDIVESGTPGKIIYPGFTLAKSDTIQTTGNSATGSIKIAFYPV